VTIPHSTPRPVIRSRRDVRPARSRRPLPQERDRHHDKRRRIEDLALLLSSVLEARQRVMIEVNASGDCLAQVVAVLPAMRRPTVSPLFGNGSYAVKAAVRRDALPQIIPAVKAAGGTDVIVSTLSQIVP